MIVVKFGGTSVGDAEAINRASDIVRSRLDRRPLVVVSALAGTTGALLAIADQAAEGHIIGAERGIQNLRERHLETAGALLASNRGYDEVMEFLNGAFDELTSLARALNVLGHVTPRSRDAMASKGEIVSSRLIAASFLEQGLPVEHTDARRVMITDDRFGRAEPQTELIADACQRTLMPLIARERVPVMGGYVGTTRSGIVTTIGRGGSDLTASLLGAALGADAIEIWTDVDGMLTADPRVVSGARLIDRIRFGEASELATFGARVLHPSTIMPAVRLGIPVYVMNARHPNGRGTLITYEAPECPVRAIAAKSGITVVKLRTPRMLLQHGYLRRVFEVFEKHGTSVDVVATSEVSISLTVDDTTHLDSLVVDLSQLGDVSVARNRGCLSIVGSALAEDSATLARALAAIAPTKVHMLSLSASGINLTLVVDEDEVPNAVRALHDEFFAGDP